MKTVFGYDLGTTSIGVAVVKQAESQEEKSSIVKAAVRVIPLSVDEKDSFEKGKAITTNADRTLKRSMRRNLQRYKLRRDNLIEILKREGWISDDSIISENGARSTFSTIKSRAAAADKEISLEELSKVLLMINKKRGYKSNRKADSKEEGQLIDGMEIAMALYDEGITPAEMSLRLLDKGKKVLPDYYRSDLEHEFQIIWETQEKYYPDILTDDFKKQISNQGGLSISKIFLAKYGLFTADNKGKDKKRTALEWRVRAQKEEVEKEILAYVIADVRGHISNSSGYLGAISDRSKELFFKKITVGQYIYQLIQADPQASTKNKVFYRQDYLDEFERIWECQKKFHPELTDTLKSEIRDTVIFYQRNLKSQKGLISFCEFESQKIDLTIDGKKQTKIRGSKVAPRSSMLFQEFKIWSCLNNLVLSEPVAGREYYLSLEQKEDLYKELSIKSSLKDKEVLKLLGYKPGRYELNYKELDGNKTLCTLYSKYLDIVNASGHGEYVLSKLNYSQARGIIEDVFKVLGFNCEILDFNSNLGKEEFEQQAIFKLWHLLYSYEGDKSVTGNDSLIKKISHICNMPDEFARILASTRFIEDYASLSHKAILNILPYLKEGNDYSQACLLAGYNHSDSKTKEENNNRELKDRLELLPKGALHNPVVEKILNQMVNVTNTLCDTYGKPDEIHIEFARELKQNAKQREEATKHIQERTKENERIAKIISEKCGPSNVTPNNILKFRLYEELKENGYKALYSDQYISFEDLFSPNVNIEHIIPQALLFDDSFSNKTLEKTDVNIKKGKRTAADFVLEEYSEQGYERYKLRVDDLFNRGVISKSKHQKLLMKQTDIPEDFVNRDLTNSQYIAKKAKEMLEEIARTVVVTNGSITARLREDWQLVDVMKELNLAKYQKAGLTYTIERDSGQKVQKIQDWTKRNDHRHHAMDAITIAFTRPSHIQILNSLNACTDNTSSAYAIKLKETELKGSKWTFKPPIAIEVFRTEVKDALENILVSIKAKNKVVTRNANKIKTAKGIITKTELTPRGALHKEQVYGLRKKYEVEYKPVNAKMTEDVIRTVANKKQREALLEQLKQYGGDPKKAFTGKNATKEKVKCVRFKTVFSIRKTIGPDINIEKILDIKVRRILQERLEQFGGDPRKAFANLENDPIWLNKEKNIRIKSVAIEENFDLTAIRDKRDKDGNYILDVNGDRIASDFVNLRNNHHIAIFEDESGNYQEVVVPFFEALNRINMGAPVVDRDYMKDCGWKFLFTMKVNEMFVFPNKETGFDPSEINLMNPGNYKLISPNLFRVQNLSSGDYNFRHHLETTISGGSELRDITWKRIQNVNGLKGAIKIRINHIGQIVSVGEDG